ncbi:hypothetical protein BDW68DRAFT_153685 [Aspergillus falconensis]
MAAGSMNKLKRRRSRWKPKHSVNNRTHARNHKWGLVLRKAEGQAPASSVLATGQPPIIPNIPPEGRRRGVYEAAMESRKANSWLKDNQYNLDQLKTVQCTWQVQLVDFPGTGYAFRIYLLWDYDRLWGVFNLGHTKGVMLVDPGPRISSSSDDPQQLSFLWRGVRANDPNTYICDNSIAKGEIWLNPCHKRLGGYFDYIAGNGMAGGDRCYFRAGPRFGPPVVPYSLEDVVDEWDEYGSSKYPREEIRQDLSLDDLVADLRKRDRRRPMSAVWDFRNGHTSAVGFTVP